jgi:hypothetical protein
MSMRRCFLGALAVLSASIVMLAMSGTGASAEPDTNSVFDVDKIAEVDFGNISGMMMMSFICSCRNKK